MKLNISLNDAYRLVDFMEQFDNAYYSVIGSWDDIMKLSSAIFLKSSVLIWERISKDLGLDIQITASMPVITRDDVKNEEPEVMDNAFEFITEGCLGIDTVDCILDAAGISYEYYDDTLSMESVYGYFDDESVRDDEKIFEFLSDVAPGLYKDFPVEAKSVLEFSEDYGFYPMNMIYLHSKRVGNYMRQEDTLSRLLPKDLHQRIMSVINKIFNPMYISIPDLTLCEMNADGEYCGLSTLGYFDTTCEDVTKFCKRPYANVAVSVLDYLLSEAEMLAPHLLGKDVATSCSDSMSEVKVATAA